MQDNMHSIKINVGNKVTVYALKGDVDMIVRSEAEPFVSESAIVHASRPKDIPLAVMNYGRLVSSPMGNNITATIRLPKGMASRDEFLRQMDMLFAHSIAPENDMYNNESMNL